MRKVAFLMGPRMLGLAAGQLNFIVSTILASGLPAGSVTAYNYAFQLSQIPVGCWASAWRWRSSRPSAATRRWAR